MHLTFRNVNSAFKGVIEGISQNKIPTTKTPSRNGPVIRIDGPTIITYTHPRERVLFNQSRDANPFFHLYESLWMLAGRDDVASLKYYASKISDFSDDGETFNGAYGYRWRSAYGGTKERFGYDTETTWKERQEIDQLSVIIDHLKRNPESRRVVLQMWNVEDDLLKIDSSKDVCCNLSVIFEVRHDTDLTGCTHSSKYKKDFPYCAQYECDVHPPAMVLDMTVTNRSNDIIWGMLGANVVHFSFLQEYIACALGIEVGHYHQFTTNAHVYTETNSGWHPDKWLSEYQHRTQHSPPQIEYGRNVQVSPTLVSGPKSSIELFDSEIQAIVNENNTAAFSYRPTYWTSDFLQFTAQRAFKAFQFYKGKDYGRAKSWAESIQGEDWRIACTQWIERRLEKLKSKSG